MINEPKMRTCPKCKQQKELVAFVPTPSPFFPRNYSFLCISCLETMAAADNLGQIDALCRHLDIPFDPDAWTSLYEIHKDHTLTAYIEFLTDERYQASSWSEENEKWRQAREQKTIEEKISIIDRAHFRSLRERWSGAYNEEELLFLDDLYKKINSTQNVSTPILQEYATNFCEISLHIKKGLREGLDVKKLMDARDNIIKVAGFDSKNAKNVSDFDSVGELIVYLNKKGWHPNWAKENQDVVDMTMHNVQQYLKRLVMNEGNIAEQVEARREAFNTAQRLEDDALTESVLKTYEDSSLPTDYEDEDDLAKELSEWEV